MTLRDRAVLGLLSIVLVVLTGAVVAPSFGPAGPRDTPPPSLPPIRPYVEGVVGSATSASPFSARTAAERSIVALLFRGLVRLGPADTVIGDLAESWETDPTGRIWTFHLRPGLVWHDGQPLTSADVEFTISALSDPSYAGPGAASWREVTVTAPDEETVVLTLATPLGGFLFAAATQPIAPLHILGGVAATDLPEHAFGRHPVGSGPFRLTVLDAEHAVLVPAVPDVREPDGGIPGTATPRPTDSLATPKPTARPAEPLPYLEGIELRFFDDPADLVAAWEAGELDGAAGLAPAEAAALAETDGARLIGYPTTTLLSVTLNLRPNHPEFRDPAVRRALLTAIDRDAIVAEELAGQGDRADAPIPRSSWAFDSGSSPIVAHDPAAARASLTAAGWKEAEGGGWIPTGATEALSIALLCPEEAANPTTYAVAEAIAEAWRAIGLDVTLEPHAGADLVTALHGGEFAAAVIGMGIGLDPDLYPLLASTQVTSGGSNVAGLQDPALDPLLVAARAPGTLEARKAAYIALQVRFAAQLYLLPIAFRDEVIVVRDTLQGPQIRAVGSPGDRFWDVLTWRLADDR